MADEVPTEALQAAARALATEDAGLWAYVQDEAGYLRLAHATLTAAAPYLIAEGRRQAPAEIRGADTYDWLGGRAYEVADCQEKAARVAEGAEHG